MTEYIFEGRQEDQELRRLRLIEEALDPTTIKRIQGTGICAGWRCLELGAGAGSIARWIGEVVGDRGQVVAVDLKSDYLQHLSGPTYRIVEGDFIDVPLQGGFDLAHCRYVLIHNRQSRAMLSKLRSLLQSGGFLVVEEPDFTSARLLNGDGDASQQRVNKAICRMFEQRELDPAYGLHLPDEIAAAGLQIQHIDARIHLSRGGDLIAQMMAASTLALAEKYVATGEATPADIQRYIENAGDERFCSIYYSTVSLVASKP